jgi:hypothetical protein
MKIYSSKHQAIVEAPIREKPEYSEGDDAFDRQLNYQIKMQAYNKWLSTHKPVPDEFKDYWADGQEVPDSAYEVKKQWLREKANQWLDVDMHLPINYYCKTRLVAIPKKEKEDLEPEASNTDEASVASHSCTVGNSIEQRFYSECCAKWDYDYVLQKTNPKELLEWIIRNTEDFYLKAWQEQSIKKQELEIENAQWQDAFKKMSDLVHAHKEYIKDMRLALSLIITELEGSPVKFFAKDGIISLCKSYMPCSTE